jgi:hypothetical protein
MKRQSPEQMQVGYRRRTMSIDDDGLEHGETAEHLRRLEQRLAEVDKFLGQLDLTIQEAERKSMYVIREVAPLFEDA